MGIMQAICMFVLWGMNQSSPILIDSSANAYTLWGGQDRECIMYNRTVDVIASVNRDFILSGNLNVHSAPGDLSSIISDQWYSQEFGPARYPFIYGSDYALYITFPYLISGAGSGIACQYVEWSGPGSAGVDIGPGNINAYRSYLKELPNGNLHFLLKTVTDEWLYRIYTPDLSVCIDSGSYPSLTGWNYWGSDYNAGTFYLAFYKYFEAESLYKVLFYYPNLDTWDLALPAPYPPNIGCTQLAVTDNGSPLLVFDWATHTNRVDIYVSYASGVAPVNITAPFPDTKCTYPTIATAGNYVVVIFNKPRTDSVAWNDIYKSYSTDNGLHWSIPENITQWSSWRIGLQHIAKRIDPFRNRAYYIFARTMYGNEDPFLYPDYPIYIYWNYVPVVGGIEERDRHISNTKGYRLESPPLIIGHNAELEFSISERQHICLVLYDGLGRKAMTITQGMFEPGVYAVCLDTSHLSSGVYFLVLEGQKGRKSQKVLILR
ncbi:MAG: hypothetical protein ACUVUH_10070 [bacterium]